jgi:hypothetical protein
MERGKEWTEDEIYKMLKAEEEKKEKRIKRRNKKPEYMRMVQTNEGETKIFCAIRNGTQPHKIQRGRGNN